MEGDWDLHAVVRGCTAITTTNTTTTATSSSSAAVTNNATTYRQDCNFSTAGLRDLFEPRRESFVQELHDLYKPFFPIIMSQESPSSSSSQTVFSPQSLPISPLSVLGGLQDLPPEQPQMMKQFPPQTQLRQKQPPFSVAKASVSHRSKRRKNNLKRVCHVAAENLSSDMWSWRKYGQKPIKGSPYPRGYYRCSTSKGCMARKQVERNRSDPGMFIVTYTAEHNHPMPTHRNSLAGSTRPKQAETETPNSDDPTKPSSPPDKMESSRDDVADVDDDDFSVSDMALDDDFFAGLEDFTTVEDGDCVPGQFPATAQLPWFSNSATTIAGGG